MNEDLRYIAAIAEHGSISKAARAVHISQPGLSQRLKRIESQMGTALFDRTSVPLKPTASGEVVLRYALRAIAAEDTMLREVSTVASEQKRRLRIGVAMPRANALLGDAIMEFYESYHSCSIELHDLTSLEQLHEYFLQDEIDFAILTSISPDPELYKLEVLCRERLMVALSAKFNAPQLEEAQDSRVSISQLEGIPFVLPTSGPYFDPIINHLVTASGTQLDIVVRDCAAPLALSLVENGLGALIAPSTFLIGHSGLRSFDLADIEAGNVLRYIRRSDRPLSIEEERFVALVRSWVADNIRP